ncbi:MAG: zinc-ribbon domain-containing protein, partial [Proteobacteria bacterium]|nr:zinc-ribbon domain-containing protein [Pseudomonadota bacterium]
MNVICQQCKTKLNIPEHKLLQDKESVFKCPKCKEKITVPPVNKSNPLASSTNDISKPFFDDRENAMICIEDPVMKKKVFSMIAQMGFNAETVIDVKDALERMEYHVYHLVILDGDFDEKKGTQRILSRMNTIDMSLRRQICLVLISNRYNSNDNMAALHASVNNIIHMDDISHLDSFLSQI